MKKKILIALSIILLVVMALSLCACNVTEKNFTDYFNTEAEPQRAPTFNSRDFSSIEDATILDKASGSFIYSKLQNGKQMMYVASISNSEVTSKAICEMADVVEHGAVTRDTYGGYALYRVVERISEDQSRFYYYSPNGSLLLGSFENDRIKHIANTDFFYDTETGDVYYGLNGSINRYQDVNYYNAGFDEKALSGEMVGGYFVVVTQDGDGEDHGVTYFDRKANYLSSYIFNSSMYENSNAYVLSDGSTLFQGIRKHPDSSKVFDFVNVDGTLYSVDHVLYNPEKQKAKELDLDYLIIDVNNSVYDPDFSEIYNEEKVENLVRAYRIETGLFDGYLSREQVLVGVLTNKGKITGFFNDVVPYYSSAYVSGGRVAVYSFDGTFEACHIFKDKEKIATVSLSGKTFFEYDFTYQAGSCFYDALDGSELSKPFKEIRLINEEDALYYHEETYYFLNTKDGSIVQTVQATLYDDSISGIYIFDGVRKVLTDRYGERLASGNILNVVSYYSNLWYVVHVDGDYYFIS